MQKEKERQREREEDTQRVINVDTHTERHTDGDEEIIHPHNSYSSVSYCITHIAITCG